MQEKKDIENQRRMIYVIGIGASGPKDLPIYLQRKIISAKKIAGPSRVLNLLPQWWLSLNNQLPIPELFTSDKPKELIRWLQERSDNTVLLSTGDPLWFGIGRNLIESFPIEELEFHPSPSCLQLAFARIGRHWQDAKWISLHGRQPDSLGKILRERPNALAIIPDPNRGGFKEVREFLKSSGLESFYALWLFESLGSKDERVRIIQPKDNFPNDLNPLHLVVLIANKDLSIEKKDLPLIGIDDGIYKHYEDLPGLLTKKEPRVQILADLELPEEGVLWDICAGVGTIGLESLRLRPKLNLLSIEKRIGSKKLIEYNANLLDVRPLEIKESNAISVLKEMKINSLLQKPDRVILGGGGLKRTQLLKEIIKHLSQGSIIVIPLATIEAIEGIKTILEASKYETSIKQIQSWRGVNLSGGTRLDPINPVFIVKGKLSK